MCDPVTLGVTAAVVGAAGSITTGIMGAKAAKQNSGELMRQAELRREKGEYDVRQAVTKYERQRGQTVASAATTGLSLQSFGDIFADSAIESALEVSAIRWGARNDSDNLRGQARNEVTKGNAAMIGGLFGGAGALLTGGAKVASYGGSAGTGSVGIGDWSTTINTNFRG